MNVLHYFLQHRSIYTFPLSHFVSTFQNLLNVRVRYFHYIWSKKRRTVLLWTVKYKITTKITFIRWYFNVLGHGSYTYKSYSLETFLQHFGFFRVWFCFLFFLFCFPLEFVLCWSVDVFKGRGGGGSEISPLYFLYIVVRFRQRKRKLISFILHMRTDRNWYLIYAHSRVFRMRYDDLVWIFSSAD